MTYPMAHIYHHSLPGYDESQILHDGCPECERRGESVDIALAHLDPENFERAWKRAADWRLHGCPTLSNAEMRLLDTLWTVQVQLERRGLPIGELPGGAVHV